MMKPKSSSNNRSLRGVLSPESEIPKVCQEKNSNVIVKGTRARASERLRQKQRRKELANHRKFYHSLESQARELLGGTLEYENPAHKILFLTRLGLSPKSETQVPNSLRLPKALAKKDGSQHSSDSDLSPSTESPTSDTDNSVLVGESSDEQDLELMISPIDIPEIFQEVQRVTPVMDNAIIVPRNITTAKSKKVKKALVNDLTVGRSARTSPRVSKTASNSKQSVVSSAARTIPNEAYRDAPLDLSTATTNRSQQFTDLPNLLRNTDARPILNPGNQPVQSVPLPIKIPKMQAVLLPIPNQRKPMPSLIPHQNIPLFCRPLMKQIPKCEEIPCIDLTSEEDEERDTIAAIRKKLLSLDTILEFADRR